MRQLLKRIMCRLRGHAIAARYRPVDALLAASLGMPQLLPLDLICIRCRVVIAHVPASALPASHPLPRITLNPTEA